MAGTGSPHAGRRAVIADSLFPALVLYLQKPCQLAARKITKRPAAPCWVLVFNSQFNSFLNGFLDISH
jgi:hypothetical protein